jgi:hypothetical protein
MARALAVTQSAPSTGVAALLSPALPRLLGLVALDLSRTGLNAGDGAALAPAIAQLTRLELLNMRDCPGMLRVLPVLPGLPALHSLNVSTSLGLLSDSDGGGGAVLAQWLSALTTLTALDMSGHWVPAMAVAAALAALPRLRVAVLNNVHWCKDDGSLEQDSLDHVWTGTPTPLPRLSHLCAQGCIAGEKFAALALTPDLVHLDLSGATLTSMSGFAIALARARQLTSLHFEVRALFLWCLMTGSVVITASVLPL